MAEWLKASVLKTDSGCKLLVGSNPTLSVIFICFSALLAIRFAFKFAFMKEKRKYEEI